ncbi:MAG TPA: methyltransferase domain-containing protein [Solirubrobacterales bacterium]|nr:methyltransferase domain-containing protein [Solirubrobacterales bacterium]
MPMYEESIRSEFTHQTESFARNEVATKAETLGALVELVPEDPEARWLETACGPAAISRSMAARVNRVHGVDLTPSMVEKAATEAEAAGIGNAEFSVGDATALEFEDACFDGAVTRFSLHHIPAPARVVAEMARVVRPGGWVILSDFIADPDRDVYAAVEEIERLRDPSHWSCLTAEQLRRIGADFGLELESERLIPFDLDYEDWLQRGSGGPAAAELIDELLERLTEGSGCFRVYEGESGRRLALVNSLTRWRRV